MRAVFKLEDHSSTCAVLVLILVPVFHIVFPLPLSARSGGGSATVCDALSSQLCSLCLRSGPR
jgi:hypothetical protein